MLVALEMQLGFVNIVFYKILSTTAGEIYQGEFFMHVSEISVFGKIKETYELSSACY